jgi:prepilin-type N-terminal cleavage/methylation domain-containing protein
MCYRRCAGFTLIELSIVLVIIGLVVGGITVGRDLIKAAEIRKEVADLTSYDAAVNTFRTKYNGIPGDFNQTGVIPGLADNHIGDGDGFVTMNDLWIGSSPWEQLSKAGLIQGYYGNDQSYLVNDSCLANVSCPPTPFNATSVHFMMGMSAMWGGYLYSSPLAGSNANISITIFNGTGVAHSLTGNLTVDQAYALDVKLDDGVAHSGRLMTENAQGAGSGCVDGASADDPLDFTTFSYDYNLTTDTADDCWPVYVMR